MGENDCANPQAVCPRLAGEGYEKCQTICRQGEHAEIKALRQLEGSDLRHAVAYIHGHYYICEPCGAALRDAGIGRVVIVPSK
jgi:pyrimidine deaminase RibD-like protein